MMRMVMLLVNRNDCVLLTTKSSLNFYKKIHKMYLTHAESCTIIS